MIDLKDYPEEFLDKYLTNEILQDGQQKNIKLKFQDKLKLKKLRADQNIVRRERVSSIMLKESYRAYEAIRLCESSNLTVSDSNTQHQYDVENITTFNDINDKKKNKQPFNIYGVGQNQNKLDAAYDVNQPSDDEEDLSQNQFQGADAWLNGMKQYMVKLRNRPRKSTQLTTSKLVSIKREIDQLIENNNYDDSNKPIQLQINDILTPSQKRNITKTINLKIEDLDQRMQTLEDDNIDIDSYDEGVNDLETKQSDDEFTLDEDKDTQSNTSKVNGKVTIKVLDRQDLILRIFHQNAKSQLSKTQIDLATLKLARANLVRDHGAFMNFNALKNQLFEGQVNENVTSIIKNEKQRASNQNKGPGETQLEVEKRILSSIESKLKTKVEKQIKSSEIVMKQRQEKFRDHCVPTVSVIGQTNAGKTKLINMLCKSELSSKDNLFETLDVSMKKTQIAQQLFFLQDTIGFISNLPNELFQTFSSTLTQLKQSDIILHIIDSSNPEQDLHIQTIQKELDTMNIPQDNRVIEVYNKTDLLRDPLDYNELILREDKYGISTIPISCATEQNFQKLTDIISKKSFQILSKDEINLKIPFLHVNERCRWLKINSNIHQDSNVQDNIVTHYKEGSKGFIELKVNMTKSKYQMQMKMFDSVDREILGNKRMQANDDTNEINQHKHRQNIDPNIDQRVKKYQMRKDMSEEDIVEKKIRNKKLEQERMKQLQFHDD